jgi:hypothetical protein
MLLRKCATAVIAMASSRGKKQANTGIKIVPSPNPEKRVRTAARRAVMQMRRVCMRMGIFL